MNHIALFHYDMLLIKNRSLCLFDAHVTIQNRLLVACIYSHYIYLTAKLPLQRRRGKINSAHSPTGCSCQETSKCPTVMIIPQTPIGAYIIDILLATLDRGLYKRHFLAHTHSQHTRFRITCLRISF